MAFALAYAVSGTVSRAAELSNIPRSTAIGWTRSEWWSALLDQARQIKQSELDARYTDIIDKSTALLSKMLDDPSNIKNIKDLAVVSAIAHDKRALMRGDPTSRSEKVSPESRLNKLKSQFQEMVSHKNNSNSMPKSDVSH